MGEKTGCHITVSGRVQGVGYRYYCAQTAGSMGLCGYVMNMDDGTVTLEVFGEQEKIKDFIDEITRTDRIFSVSECVTEQFITDKGYKDFIIKLY